MPCRPGSKSDSPEGFSLLASYSWSKTMTDGADGLWNGPGATSQLVLPGAARTLSRPTISRSAS